MNINWQQLFNQLAPGISPVNIGLTVLGFMLFWPLGLFMLAYIFWGPSWGLDLRRNETWVPALQQAGAKVGQFFRAGAESLKGDSSVSDTGTPSIEKESREGFEQWREREKRKIEIERARLDKERAEFEATRRATEKNG